MKCMETTKLEGGFFFMTFMVYLTPSYDTDYVIEKHIPLPL